MLGDDASAIAFYQQAPRSTSRRTTPITSPPVSTTWLMPTVAGAAALMAAGDAASPHFRKRPPLAARCTKPLARECDHADLPRLVLNTQVAGATPLGDLDGMGELREQPLASGADRRPPDA